MVIRWLDKIIKISKVVVVILACLLVVLTATSIFLQDRVADIVLKKLNEKIVTKYSYESVKFSLLAKFPRASLELKNVVVLSSPGFDKGSFEGISGDTLLAAKSFYAEFKIMEIIGGEYNIGSISVENGSLTLLSDTSGKVNYEFIAETGKSGGEVALDLSKINLSNIDAIYFNKATDIRIEGNVDKGTLKTKIVGDNIDFIADATAIIESMRINYLNITSPFNTTVNIKLSGSDAGVMLDNSTIKINKNLVSVSGLVGSDNNLDLSVKGDNLNISRIKEYLPPAVSSKLTDYSATGTLNLSGTIKGNIERTSLPKIDFSFLAQNGTISRVGSNQTISGLFIQGSYTNGAKRSAETSTLKIDEIKGAIEGYIFRGSLNVQNFATPLISVVMDGQGNIGDLSNFLKIKEIKSASGKLAINIKAKGVYDRERKYGITDFLSFNPTIVLGADSLNINLRNDKLVLEMVNGDLTITDDVVADNVAFKYKNQSILVDGRSNNLAAWLMGKDVIVTSNATLKADNLFPETFFSSDLIAPATGGSTGVSEKKAFKFPDDMVFDLQFDISHFLYKELLAENMVGSISYKPTLFNIKNLKADIFSGNASANGFLIKNSDKSLMARGTFDLDKIEIQQAFNVFNNFGQSYLKSENIEGKLSGTVSALVSMDSLFTPNMKTLNVEGNYLITDGALLDFEPIQSLSKFIEVSELEDIRFESLRNELLIRNNYVYIPQMEIKSSAADLSVNGKHSFDNDYEYHIKILLSEILSSKFSRARSSNQEFGAIEDDGLGRSTLMLVIDTDGVRYDMKAVGEKIKTEIQEERRNLRQILNEEYGWYGDKVTVEEQNTPTSATDNRLKVEWEENAVESGEEDSLALPPVQNGTIQEPTTPRFKIIWDDAPLEEEEVTETDNSSGRRSLFR